MMWLYVALALLLTLGHDAEASSIVLPMLLDVQPMVLAIDVASPVPIDRQLNAFCSRHLIVNGRCHVLSEAVAEIVQAQRAAQANCRPNSEPIDVSFALVKNVLVSPDARSMTTFKWMKDAPHNIAIDICQFLKSQASSGGDASVLDECEGMLAFAFARSFDWINSLSICELPDHNQRRPVVSVSSSLKEPLALEEPLAQKILAVEQLIASIKNAPRPVSMPRPLRRVSNDVYLTPWSDEEETEQDWKRSNKEKQEETSTLQSACHCPPPTPTPSEHNTDAVVSVDAVSVLSELDNKTSSAKDLFDLFQEIRADAVEPAIAESKGNTDVIAIPERFETPVAVVGHDPPDQTYDISGVESLDALFDALTMLVGMTLVLVIIQAGFECLLMVLQRNVSVLVLSSWRLRSTPKILTSMTTPMTMSAIKESSTRKEECVVTGTRFERLARLNIILESTRLRLALARWHTDMKTASAPPPERYETFEAQTEPPKASHPGIAPSRLVSIAAASLFVTQHSLPYTATRKPRSGETSQTLREVTELLSASSSTDELWQRLRLSERLLRLRRRIAARTIQRKWRERKQLRDQRVKENSPHETVSLFRRIRQMHAGFSLFQQRLESQTAPPA